MSYESFNYSLPNEPEFYETLLGWLKIRNEEEITSILKGGRCVFNPTGSFSGIRWNAQGVKIYFYLNMEKLPKITKEITGKIIAIGNEILPKENGYDIVLAEFSPKIELPTKIPSLQEDMDNTIKEINSEIISDILPTEIQKKGKEMTEAYLYLYCVENSLRLFIEKISIKYFGMDYFDKLQLNSDIRNRLLTRKEEESKNKWKRIRGNSDIFYLDFKDLSTIIRNNWNLFSKFFPEQNWIESKITELAQCRNLIAHNSYLENHEKDVIRINFNSILRQIGSAT